MELENDPYGGSLDSRTGEQQDSESIVIEEASQLSTIRATDVLDKFVRLLKHDTNSVFTKVMWISVLEMARDSFFHRLEEIGIPIDWLRSIRELLRNTDQDHPDNNDFLLELLSENPHLAEVLLNFAVESTGFGILDWISSLNLAVKMQFDRTVRMLTSGPEPQRVDFENVFNDIIEFIRYRHKKESQAGLYNLSIHSLVSSEEGFLGLSIRAFPGLIESTISNLVGNAIEAFEKQVGEGTLQIDFVISDSPAALLAPRAFSRTFVDSGGCPKYLYLGISDNGPGMGKEVLADLNQHIRLGIISNIQALDSTKKAKPEEEHGIGLMLVSWLLSYQLKELNIPFVVRAYNGRDTEGCEMPGFHFDFCIEVCD